MASVSVVEDATVSAVAGVDDIQMVVVAVVVAPVYVSVEYLVVEVAAVMNCVVVATQ